MATFNSNIVNSVVSEPKLSESQIQLMVKNVGVENVFGDCVTDYIQIDTHKYVIPVDIEGTIRYLEVDFVAKKSDFDPEKAHHDYEVKVYNAAKREQEKTTKKAEKQAKTKPVANGK